MTMRYECRIWVKDCCLNDNIYESVICMQSEIFIVLCDILRIDHIGTSLIKSFINKNKINVLNKH